MLPLLVANLKIMVRDRQALFWALAFPLMLVTIFGLFDINGAGSADLAVIDHANTQTSRELRRKLAAMDYLVIELGYPSEAAAQEDLEDGALEYVLVIPRNLADISNVSGSVDLDGLESGSVAPGQPVSLQLYHDVGNDVGNEWSSRPSRISSTKRT